MIQKIKLNREDIIPMAEYKKIRTERRREIVTVKRDRRMEIGPVAVCNFECYESMWQQVHEMLYIEKGGEEQIATELAAYNPLIPNGNELVCTVMFEIDEPARRKAFLSRLGGIEETMTIEFKGETITGIPEEDVDRTTEGGKASAVQFLHFPFSRSQINTFQQPYTQVIVGFKHPHYAHLAVMPEITRGALAKDFR
ncbi:MAG: hypothetical protein CFH10_01619 [Alphaproteobacteria bacterium MarineAlpha4_Bin2]|nr:MAG: hypothetical protein CFH10_01619 [Alphaproteobacteria bacterium MarineAlpha4_Bin2]